MNNSDELVREFMELMRTSSLGGHRVPRKLALASGRSTNTGYRRIKELERYGFLSRDTSAIYIAGPEARQAGFSAWGFGELSAPAPPVLVALRHETLRTAFTGFVRDGLLWIALFSIGRGTEYAIPEPETPLAIESNQTGNDEIAATLRVRGASTGDLNAPHAARVAILSQRRGVTAVCGIMSNGFTPVIGENLEDAVLRAGRKMQSGIDQSV